MTKIPALALTATALVLGLTACGGSSSSSSSSAAPSATSSATSAPATSAAPAGALALAANPQGQLKYDKKSLTAKAGKVTINFTNQAPLQHNVTIQKGTGSSGPILGATPTFSGGSKTLTLNLKPGTYTFFCSVPGHRMAGMQGTLVVK